MQSRNWRKVVHRVAEASGGAAPLDVRKQTERLTDAEAEHLNARVRQVIDRRKRADSEPAQAGARH